MYVNFTSNTTKTGKTSTKAVTLVATGTWGSGTLAFEIYDEDFGDYLTVNSWTADTAQEVVVGAGTEYQLAFTGGSGQDVDVSVRDARESGLG